MLNRPALFFWVSIRIEGSHRFRLSLPIPLGIVFSLTDMAEDIGFLWRFFSGKKKEALPAERNLGQYAVECFSSPNPEMLLTICRLIRNLLKEIMFRWGATDLVDADVQTGEERVLVRCSFR